MAIERDSTALILRRAAQLINEHGHARFNNIDAKGRICVLEAIDRAAFDLARTRREILARQALSSNIRFSSYTLSSSRIIDWNMRRPKWWIVRKLRKVADKYENENG